MITSSQFALISPALKQAAALARDGLGDLRGAGLPYRTERVATAECLNRILRDHALHSCARQASISAVHNLGIPSISSNCNNLVLRIEQSANPEPLPDTLFIKLPGSSLVTRWFFNVIEAWKLECHFFRQLAAHIPIRTPLTYAAATQGTRFALIQENLHADPSARLFTNMDMLDGPSMETVRKCLDCFAKLHAHHYHLSAREREALLPQRLHLFRGPTMGRLSPVLSRLGLPACKSKYPELIDSGLTELYNLTLDNWQALLDYWFSGPLSLIHGDSHLGNFFISGDEMGMLDWQAVHWGQGIRDVSYFLNNSLPSALLAVQERDLISYYVERRSHYGTAINLTETWQLYRSLSFHPLMTIVVSIGFGAMNDEQNNLMKEILERSIATIERVDFAGWLDQFLSESQRAN